MIKSEIAETVNCAADLISTVNALTERLVPVLSPDSEQSNKMATPEVPVLPCEVAEDIAKIRATILVASSKVQGLIDHLEI